MPKLPPLPHLLPLLVLSLAGVVSVMAADPASRPALQLATQPTSQPTTQTTLRRVHVYVSGTVQGVNYRAFVQEAAGELKVVGWVRNLADSRVEAELEGPPAAVQELLTRMNRGPTRARVSGVEVTDQKLLETEKTFEVRQ